MDKEYPKIVIVNENDDVIGAEDYLVAVEKNLLRRASRIFVFNEEGRLLIQKRSIAISQPLLFDQSVGGHVDEGEEYIDAAVREMREEIGLVDFPLTEIVISYREEHFYNAVYKTVIPTGTIINFDPEEVDSVYWMSPEEVDLLITESPDLCTFSLCDVWTKYRNELI